MPNQWIEFVKMYSTYHKLPYGCAISEASKAYKLYKQGVDSDTAIIGIDLTMKKKKKKEKVFESQPETEPELETVQEIKEKKPRGRPRIHAIQEVTDKKPRGRPRKIQM